MGTAHFFPGGRESRPGFDILAPSTGRPTTAGSTVPPHPGRGPSMRTTRAAAVSMNGFLGEPDRVLNAIDAWGERLAGEGVELALFPELFAPMMQGALGNPHIVGDLRQRLLPILRQLHGFQLKLCA